MTKGKEWVLYPLEIVYVVRNIIRMYSRIAKNQKTEWICLCDVGEFLNKKIYKPVAYETQGKIRELLLIVYAGCEYCPANNTEDGPSCQGPGGNYRSISISVRRGYIKHSGAIRKAAKKKAFAWTEWFNKQKFLWSLQGYKF